MPKVIEIKNLSFNYGATEILSSLDFSVESGDYVALVGPNGAGKTTLMRLMLGLEIANQGQVLLFSEDSRSFHDWHLLGYLPQSFKAFNPLFPATVKEVVRLGLLASKSWPRRFHKQDEEIVLETLKLMDISDLENKLISELSGGQEQRVFLARALVAKPRLLILDEPGTGLDPQARDNFFALIKKLNQEEGMTIILITHDISQSGQYANKLMYLDKSIIFYGSFSEFCHSDKMSSYFGEFSQHLICHQHDH